MTNGFGHSLSSEPRVLVIGGVQEQWSSKTLRDDQKLGNGVEAWAYACNGDYCGHTLVTSTMIKEYDVVICNTNETHNPTYTQQYLKLAEQRPAHVKWVSLLEGNMAEYMVPSATVRAVFNASDLVNCINKNLTDALQTLSSTPVRYIGIPYPVDAVKQYRVPITSRKQRVYICPLLLLRFTDYAVAKQLGLEYYGYEERLIRKWKTLKSNYKRYGTVTNKDVKIQTTTLVYNDPELHVYPAVPINEYYKQNANALVWVNMDNRYTWARYVLDAAALGVPIITTHHTGHGDVLFPDTTVSHPYDIQHAVLLGKQLCCDNEFYQRVISYADSQLELYQPERIKNLLLQELS